MAEISQILKIRIKNIYGIKRVLNLLKLMEFNIENGKLNFA
jgi:hypothetical protein